LFLLILIESFACCALRLVGLGGFGRYKFGNIGSEIQKIVAPIDNLHLTASGIDFAGQANSRTTEDRFIPFDKYPRFFQFS